MFELSGDNSKRSREPGYTFLPPQIDAERSGESACGGGTQVGDPPVDYVTQNQIESICLRLCGGRAI